MGRRRRQRTDGGSRTGVRVAWPHPRPDRRRGSRDAVRRGAGVPRRRPCRRPARRPHDRGRRPRGPADRRRAPAHVDAAGGIPRQYRGHGRAHAGGDAGRATLAHAGVHGGRLVRHLHRQPARAAHAGDATLRRTRLGAGAAPGAGPGRAAVGRPLRRRGTRRPGRRRCRGAGAHRAARGAHVGRMAPMGNAGGGRHLRRGPRGPAPARDGRRDLRLARARSAPWRDAGGGCPAACRCSAASPWASAAAARRYPGGARRSARAGRGEPGSRSASGAPPAGTMCRRPPGRATTRRPGRPSPHSRTCTPWHVASTR